MSQFERIFFPRTIAVVGATSNSAKAGHGFFANLLRAGFKGKVYPVNPNEVEVLGVKAYPKVSYIPEIVDYVILCIPSHSVVPVLHDCGGKGVSAVQMFTAGFRETGKAEDIQLEEEISRIAKKYGFRIIGPNCIGVYSPSVNMTCGPIGDMGEKGAIAFISQSGGHATRIIKEGIARGIGYSKGVSFGNGCDLDSIDFLEYLAEDEETEIIAAYLEGVTDGRRLLQLIGQVTRSKPVVMVKGGKTSAGAMVAASHTGSLTSSDAVWEAAIKQAGAIRVENTEEMIDTVLALERLPALQRGNVALVTGLAAGGGGDSVTSSDACVSAGLNVPPFSSSVRKELDELLTWPGTISRNPLDLSGVARSLSVLERSLDLIASDTEIDLIIVQEYVDDIEFFWPSGTIQKMNHLYIDFMKDRGKYVVLVLPPGINEEPRLAAVRELSASRIAVYPSLHRAAKSIARAREYTRWRANS